VQVSQDWLSNNVPDYFYYLDNVIFNDVGNANVNIATGVSPSSTVFNSYTNAYVFSGPGAISGSGTVTINNGGSALFNTVNDYTGDTIVNYGQLLLGNPASGSTVIYTGVTPGNLVLGNGGVYQIGTANVSEVCAFNSLVVNSGGSSIVMRNRQSSSTPYFQFASPIVRKVGGTLTLPSLATRATSKSGMYFTTPNLTNGIFGGFATIYLNDWLAIQVNPQGNFATNYNLYQISATPSAWGAASNVLLNANTAANINTATINTLKISTPSTATINAGQTLTLAAGGILIPNNSSGSATITGGTLVGAPSSDLVVINNALGNSLTIGSTIADNGGPSALTKAGEGILILKGTNTYSGVTYINGAEIASGNQSAAPLAFYNAGTLQVGAGGVAGNLGNSTTVTNYGTLAYNHSDNVTLGIPVNGPGGLTQMGTGILTLGVNNTYTGPTVISGGTLQVGAGSAAGSLGSASSITNNSTLVFDRPDAVVVNGPISGSGSLVNFGTGTLTLANTNAYGGSTTVSNGTLAFGSAASAPLTTGFNLASSGSVLDVSAISGGLPLTGGIIDQTLSGYGTVLGTVTATNNTSIIPGTLGGVGTLTFNNNLTLAGGTVNFDVSSGANDLINVAGVLSLNSGNIQLNPLATLPNGTYKLMGYGSLVGVLDNVVIAGFSQTGQLALLTNNAAAHEIDMVVYTGSGASLTWVGDGVNNVWDNGLSLDWNNGTGTSLFHNNDNVTFNDSSSNPTVNLSRNVAPGVMTINTLANNYTFAGSGSVVAGAKIIVNATNTTVTVTANLNNSGATIINTGTVQVGNGSTQGLLGIGLVTNNATLDFDEPVDTTFSGLLAGAGSIFQQGSTTLFLQGNNSAYSGPLTISSGNVDIGGGTGSGTLGSGVVTNNGTLLVQRVGTLTLNNNITGSGVVAFIGSGTTTFGGNNTYANNTYVSNGIVKLGSSTAIYADGSAGDWLILDGNANGAAGTLDLNGHNLTVNALAGLNVTQNGLVDNTGGTGTNTLSIVGSATTTYSGSLKDNAGSGGKLALVVAGAANQTLDIESTLGNNYTGGTIISNATVHLTASTAIGTPVGLGTGLVTLYNGTVYAVGGFAQNTTPTWTSLANTIYIPTNYTGTIYGPARGTMTGNITGGGILNYFTTYVRGTISGNWSIFTGQIYISGTSAGGQLGIGTTAGFGHMFLTNSGSAVVLYNTVAGTPTINIGELADDGTSTIESTTSGNAGGVAANFAVGSLNTSTNFGGGIIDNNGIIKVGTGSWTLTSANLTYAGQTTVSNGWLILAGSAALPNSTPITLNTNAVLDVSAAGSLSLGAQTLQGNGTLNGSVAAGSASTILPGWANNIGTLTVTNDLNLQGTVVMELNRTNTPLPNDRLVATTIEAGGTLQVNNLGPDLHTGDRFQLFSTNITGAFAVTNLPATTGDGTITYVWTNNLAVDGSIAVLVGVPNVNPNPTNITASVSGGVLTLTWPPDHTGWRLQNQTNTLAKGLGTNWVDVAGATTTNQVSIPVSGTNGVVFYRMIYP
jgi:autotransporter-associated beta strand protein